MLTDEFKINISDKDSLTTLITGNIEKKKKNVER